MMEKRMLVDTTLRDGEQRPGVVFRTEDKLAIAALLDEIGVYEIEAGIPCMDKSEIECIEKMMDRKKNSLISVWSRMNFGDIKTSLICKPDIIHIGAPVSYVQIYNKLKKNKTWMQKTLLDCIEIAKAEGVKVTVGFEDASRADVGFMISLIKKMKEYDVTTVRIADTVGVLTPNRAETIIKEILDEVSVDIEFHAHNDFGMAVANSIECAKAGAKYIDCTLLGIGERSGNCDLNAFVNATKYLFDFGINARKIKCAEALIQQILPWEVL